ncbi:MAG: ABC transporter substrate-binding protein [Chloroflexota bacterium]
MSPSASDSATRILFRVILATLLLLFAISSTACYSSSSTPEIVRLGVLAPFEGRHREIGYQIVFGVRLAVQEWNRGEASQDYRVEVTSLDDHSGETATERAVKAFAMEPSVVAVIGWSPEEQVNAAASYLAGEGVLYLTLTETEIVPVTDDNDFAQRYRQANILNQPPGPYSKPAHDTALKVLDEIVSLSDKGDEVSRQSLLDTFNRSD